MPVQKIVDSRKEVEIVVIESGADFVGRNGMLKMFDALEILRYEIVMAKSDFYNCHETDVFRLGGKNHKRGMNPHG